MVRRSQVLNIRNNFYCSFIALWICIFFFICIKNLTYSTLEDQELLRQELQREYDLAIRQPSLQTLQDHLLKTPSTENSTVVIVLAYFRSGSTFFGQIFNVNPNMFYMFEPLRVFEILVDTERRGNEFENTTAKLLERILRCEFTEQFSSSYMNTSTWVHYTKNLSSILRSGKKLQSPARILRKMCLRYKGNIAMKTIRVTLPDVLEFLEKYPHGNLKIIHLVRDPRGVANSLKLLGTPDDLKDAFELYLLGRLHTKPELSSLMDMSLLLPKSYHLGSNADIAQYRATINGYCHLVFHDLQIAINPPDLLRNRYKLIRYEDFAANPQVLTHKIYSFLEKPTPDSALIWLDNNTNVSYKNSSKQCLGLHKNSEETASKWRRYLNVEEVKQVQDVCGAVMELLGYKSFDTEKSLLDFSVPATSPRLNYLGEDMSIT
ncbi:carbohydrate sulfotransferase 1-like [Amphiura filiformis]|uniref:carbohydrate sulfotransferase 1-like n=1 Tax=Amphiura filiformis TaxID=82378 RepID=UPI003B212F46